MADDELKQLIGALIQRFDDVLPTLATKKDLEGFATKKDLERFATKEDLERFATKEDFARLEGRVDRIENETLVRIENEQRQMKDEQRQMKEMLGSFRMKEVARLDGRIDQLAMDVALGRKTAAE